MSPETAARTAAAILTADPIPAGQSQRGGRGRAEALEGAA